MPPEGAGGSRYFVQHFRILIQMKIGGDISIVANTESSASTKNEPGHGIFVESGGNRIKVGAIVTLSNDEVLLNIDVAKELRLANYKACELSRCFDTFEAAVTAAKQFLVLNRNSPPEPGLD
jgi:hypothetical protein